MRSDSFGPLYESQVRHEGVFVGGRRGKFWVGGGDERRCGRSPSGVEVRVECEAAVVGKQGGEGDQVGLVTVPILLQHVTGGGREEGGAGAAKDASAFDGVAVIGAASAVLRTGGVWLVGLAQCEGQSYGLERLRRR